MGQNILFRPNSVNGVTKSDWMASKNPILYKIRKEDAGFAQINNSGGFAQIQINGIDVTAFFQVGNTVFFYRTTQGTSHTGTITASAFSAGNTLITTDVATMTTSAGIINNTSKRTDWQVEVEVFNSADNTSLAGVKFRYSPSPTDWIATVDISIVIKNFVKAEWSLPAGSAEVESDTFVEFYIKYQEFYDGALISSPTNDSANSFFAIHAAKQISARNQSGPFLDQSHGGNLLSYVPEDSGRAWLTRFRINSFFHKMKMWRGWPFTLSVIYPANFTNLNCRFVQYDISNTELVSSKTALVTPGSLNRLKIPSLNASTKKVTAQLVELNIGSYSAISLPGNGQAFNSGWENASGNGAPTTPPSIQWTLGASNATTIAGGSDTETRILRPIVTLPSLRDAVIRWTFDLTLPAGKQVDIQNYVRLAGGLWGVSGQISNHVGTGSAQSVSIVTGFLTANLEDIGIALSFDNATAGLITIDNVVLEYTKTVRSSELTINVDEPCDNPIYLFWKNSAGGDSFWMFDEDQEMWFTEQDDLKKNKYLLVDNNIAEVQWFALQELISTKTTYNENIIELNSTIIKTRTQIGHQVYFVDQSGNKIGVITRDPRNITRTKRARHAFEVEIDFPDILD